MTTSKKVLTKYLKERINTWERKNVINTFDELKNEPKGKLLKLTNIERITDIIIHRLNTKIPLLGAMLKTENYKLSEKYSTIYSCVKNWGKRHYTSEDIDTPGELKKCSTWI